MARRLKPHERYLLKTEGLNPKEFLKLSETKDNLKFIHRKTNKILDVRY